jgi:soluble lytic murein transglycosylase-like protein
VVFALWLIAASCGGWPGSPVAEEAAADPLQVARLVPDAEPEIVDRRLPQPLSYADTVTYRRIFELQEEGRMAEADRLIRRLSNPLLMGHVLAQRYLHPTAWRARYDELRAWLERYADHPDAERIYRLALKRQPAGAPPPKQPVAGYLAGAGQHVPSIVDALEEGAASPPSAQAQPWLARLEELIGAGKLREAERLLADRSLQSLPALDQDRARLLLARGAFAAALDQRAFELAEAVAGRHGDQLALAHWIAGLASWRLGRYETAAHHFAILSRHPLAAGEVRSGAAFWAARANMVIGRPHIAARFFRLAADASQGFYGLLASATLGDPIGFDWRPTIVQDEVVSLLIQFPSSRRALALAQVGQWERAEGEIRKLAARARPRLLLALAALAESFDLPSAQMRVAQRLAALDGSRHDLALYPAPQWQPEDGFRIDRALLFAFVRAETGFDTSARSHRDARGPMQLLPQTAARVAKEAGIAYRGPADLENPAKNLALGQAYIEKLLAHPLAGRSLIHLAIAWNAGIARLEQWTKRFARFENDPLMFIESIPIEETRVFVRKVLANLWAYRIRFGQPVPSLELLAANEWPRYVAVDGKEDQRHARTDR